MYKTVFIVLISAWAVLAQNTYQHDSSHATILAEARFLDGNGANGAQYEQDDGVVFKEQTDAEGNRVGSYSYIDPTGERRTVSYTAGKNGFQATGDHLPKAPVPAPAPAAPAPAPYNVPYVQQRYDNSVDDGQYHPEIYETSYSAPSFPKTAPRAPLSSVFAPSPVYQQYPKYMPQFTTTTAAPRGFNVPGHLSVERKPDGYVYTFNKL